MRGARRVVLVPLLVLCSLVVLRVALHERASLTSSLGTTTLLTPWSGTGGGQDRRPSISSDSPHHDDHPPPLSNAEVAGGVQGTPRNGRERLTRAPKSPSSTAATDSRVEATFDLDRIADPVSELVALSNLKQIHHGIYRVQSALRDGGPVLQFAFKTECRPAAKWHGQQGWSEVAVYHFTQMFFGSDAAELATAPKARGVVVSMSHDLLATVVHADRCGLLDEEGRAVLRRLYPSEAENLRPGDAWLVGVALTWQPKHDDAALPPKAFHTYFLPNHASSLSPEQREVVNQIADVTLMDYLLSNEDREEKNWFFDAARRYVMMDNGWAFAGRNYQGSVCSEERSLLLCPPLLRRLDSATCKTVVNCRFRRRTIDHLHETLRQWVGAATSDTSAPTTDNFREVGSAALAWQRTMSRDPLVSIFVEQYGGLTQSKRGGRLLFNQGLARYTHGCPLAKAGQNDAATRGSLLRYLTLGLILRMEALSKHVEQCVMNHGENYVFG